MFSTRSALFAAAALLAAPLPAFAELVTVTVTRVHEGNLDGGESELDDLLIGNGHSVLTGRTYMVSNTYDVAPGAARAIPLVEISDLLMTVTDPFGGAGIGGYLAQTLVITFGPPSGPAGSFAVLVGIPAGWDSGTEQDGTAFGRLTFRNVLLAGADDPAGLPPITSFTGMEEGLPFYGGGGVKGGRGYGVGVTDFGRDTWFLTEGDPPTAPEVWLGGRVSVGVVPIPEPATLAAFGVGGAILGVGALLRRRKGSGDSLVQPVTVGVEAVMEGHE